MNVLEENLRVLLISDLDCVCLKGGAESGVSVIIISANYVLC